MTHANMDDPGSLDDGLYGLGCPIDAAGVVVIPAPFEATTSYRRGTRGGPAAVLEASVQIDLTDRVWGDAWQRGIAMLPLEACPVGAWDAEVEADALAVIEAGGAAPGDPALERVNAAGARVNSWVSDQVSKCLDRGVIPAVLGGDHSVPFGAFEAASARHPGVGVLHVDAHADLRDAYEGFTWSHASIFFNAIQRLQALGPISQVGLRDVGQAEQRMILEREQLHAFFDADLAWALAGGTPWRHLAAQIIAPLPEKVWVSFDIDGLDPALCPNTGTPVPGGLSWHQATQLLRVLVDSGRQIVGVDLCEVVPGPIDAIVGARMLLQLSMAALRSQGR